MYTSIYLDYLDSIVGRIDFFIAVISLVDSSSRLASRLCKSRQLIGELADSKVSRPATLKSRP